MHFISGSNFISTWFDADEYLEMLGGGGTINESDNALLACP
jgi:hypothetical protein